MRMGALAPVAIGTRGTIGSLVRKEIEYFTKVELDKFGNSQKPQPNSNVNMVSSKAKSSFLMLLKRKKQRGPNEFLPKTCSVTESNYFNRVPGCRYRILKDHDIN
ncbi:hypothetical protein MtrunA17_Chr4g0074631 [Medicago truncatula]|uniref:Uncharacterized protein n=2 Tax=Medicago truncatula TaxID=3880 RepID=G7JI18_MEDTR|nr:hypothetical protein MTR_4g131880 [Medicago truncatula]RHN64950.1 hypothetical protein MtrunA17_Chr4g0074631 [Medicago truncatula]